MSTAGGARCLPLGVLSVYCWGWGSLEQKASQHVTPAVEQSPEPGAEAELLRLSREMRSQGLAATQHPGG